MDGQRGIVNKIEDIIACGYSEREDLRAFDKSLRDEYYSELIGLRHRWERISLGVLDAGQITLGRDCKTILQTMDRLSELIHRADYGYTGLFNRAGTVQSETLKKVLHHDMNLARYLDQIGQDMASAEKALKDLTWPTFSASLGTITNHLQNLEENWKKRTQILRNKDERR